MYKKKPEYQWQADPADPKILGYCCSRCFKVYKLWEDAARCCEGS